jgi:Zn-dependent peptidase ImmA (M78 family)
MAHTYGHLEDYITSLLRGINITEPHHLGIDAIASRLGIDVHYLPYPAMYIEKYIFLDSRSSKRMQWQDFGHELCHVRLHEGDQALISAMQKEGQEFKAENFAQHLCIPTFMLEKMKFTEYDRDHIWRIEETFLVEKKFAEKRWEQHIRNLTYS